MHKINRFCAATFYGAILDVLVVQEILKDSVCFAKRGQYIVVQSKKYYPSEAHKTCSQVCVELKTLSYLGF